MRSIPLAHGPWTPAGGVGSPAFSWRPRARGAGGEKTALTTYYRPEDRPALHFSSGGCRRESAPVLAEETSFVSPSSVRSAPGPRRPSPDDPGSPADAIERGRNAG